MGAPSARMAALATRAPFSSGDVLSLAAGGTFARALEGAYYSAAPTSGASAFLAWASSGTRRVENRGDGLGAALLMEKAATNYALRSRELSNASWTAGGATVTADQNGGVDATSAADRVQIASAALGPYQFTCGPSGAVIGSVWTRAVSGTATKQILVVQNGAASAVSARAASVDTTYSRLSTIGGVATTDSGLVAADGRDLSGSGGTTAHAEDVYVDCAQLEAGYYPTSPIRTTSATVTRPRDALSYADGAYPVSFLTNGFTVVFAPDASSAEIVTANEDWHLVHILNWFAADCVRIRNVSGTCKVELVIAGSVVALLAVTFSRGQALTITAKPSAGKLTVSGATTGDGSNTGSGGTWATGQTLYIGADDAGANPATGRYLDARGGGSVPCLAGAPVT